MPLTENMWLLTGKIIVKKNFIMMSNSKRLV